MNEIRNTLAHRQLNEFDRALVIATHFGFQPILAPKISRRDIELVKSFNSNPFYDASEKMAVLRTYLEENLSSLPHPFAFAYKQSDTKTKVCRHALHFIGSPSGIAEASLIRTALSILTEEGHKNLVVEVNCVGDKESMAIYERELVGFVRKYGGSLTEESRQKIKEDIFNLFKLTTPDTVEIRENAPSAITYLSSASRIYFKEVLEYLEALGVDFRLVPDLIGERSYVSHTIFAVKNEEKDPLAIGYRYSRLARMMGLRKEIPMAGATIFHKEKKVEDRVFKNLPKPKFCLVQLGSDARIKTLSLIELLRSHKIPVYHFLGRDKITAQLTSAEALGVPYLIIIGQKEAISNTATIRNISTRAQDTIDITVLPDYLKSIRL